MNRNQLIERLAPRERQRLLLRCEAVPLVLEQVLCEPGAPTQHVYFPIEGFISLVTRIDCHPGLEVGMVGSEGMLGAQVGLGVATSPLLALVQGPGTALRIDRAAFVREMAVNASLRRGMHHYIYVLMAQLARSAACQRVHLIGPRLARWLLMSQDRARADQFHVTHEFLAYMLGVRRVGITNAAGALQRAGLIDYHRGTLQILDRRGLENAACSCYAAERHIYADLLA